MAEPIRLVVWDLDETFWSGTLTEGGMQYSQANHAIVVQLARRGILSSICSKNDFHRVRDILEQEGIWDYFVFPSISWEPKGPRLQSLLEAVQLRAPTVLFIDDNHANLREASFFVPDIQLADHTAVAGLLDDPLLQGKDDSELTRLAQYKLMEQRKQAEAASGGDNLGFLRSLDIRVQIEYDVDAHIDRAVELINRTNQLNYTKSRLPEDPVIARLQLRKYLRQHDVQAGLIRVSDRYGDHGYCGFYLTVTSAAGCYLHQFCFSCRILNMGVETWLYQKLGKPYLSVAGDVLTPIDRDAPAVDWIRLMPAAETAAGDGAARPSIGRLFARGGCDLAVVTHYLAPGVREMVGEFNFVRQGVDLRVDHSRFLHYALNGMTEAEQAAMRRIGYQPRDAASAMLASDEPDQVWLFSFWSDDAYYLFRHRETGLTLPFNVPWPAEWAGRGDRTQPGEPVPEEFAAHWINDALAVLRAEYDFVGPIEQDMFKATLIQALARAPSGTIGFIVIGNDRMVGADGHEFTLDGVVRLNGWIRDVVRLFPEFETVDIRQFVHGRTEVDRDDPNHFDRRVYFRLYQHLLARIAARQSELVAA